MRIKYKKRQLNVNLVFGVLWLAFGLLSLFTKENTSWTDYGYLVISVMYFALYYYQRQQGYLMIENGVMRINGSFGKKIKLTDIKEIKKFAGDYIIKTDKKELGINTQLMDPKSLVALDEELAKLNVLWR
jgi:hypothetical protein